MYARIYIYIFVSFRNYVYLFRKKMQYKYFFLTIFDRIDLIFEKYLDYSVKILFS